VAFDDIISRPASVIPVTSTNTIRRVRIVHPFAFLGPEEPSRRGFVADAHADGVIARVGVGVRTVRSRSPAERRGSLATARRGSW
jgi:hypothetical protein